jgi:hypothetical protein
MHVPLLQEVPGLQTFPHAPQLLLSVKVLVSHPFSGFKSQSAKPELQAEIWHLPDEQAGVAFAKEHMFPHAPQLRTSAVILISHPSPANALQSAKPALQANTWHWPDEQADFVTFGALQLRPHAPQLLTSVKILASHPSAAFLLQSAKPELQAKIWHTPAEQTGVAFAELQAFPQAPQFVTEVLTLVSHPSAAIPLQSPKPALHAKIWHLPAEQAGVAFAEEQTFPHAPQFATEVLTLVSHPSAAIPLQSAKPALQASAHMEF